METCVDKKASFFNFLYPFSFNPDTFLDRVKTFDNEQWNGKKGAFQVWEKQNFPEEDLLPHVTKFLNPSDSMTPTARLWRLSQKALSSPTAGIGGGEHVNISWFLSIHSKEILFQLSAMNMILFNSGIGFVVVCAEPVTDEINDWLDFLHYFRFTQGQRNVTVRANRQTGFNEITREAEYSPFFPVPTGGLEKHPKGEGVVSDIIRFLLSPIGFQKEEKDWWTEIYTPGKLLPFASIFVDNVTDPAIPNLIYLIRNFFHAKQKINPSPYDVPCEGDSLLPYGKDEWFFFSLDGGGFVALNSPENHFTRGILPDHLRKHYFLLYILTMHQRFALMKLLDDIASHWYDKNENLQNNEKHTAFEKIQNNLLSFSARGYYAQAMQGEHHHRCYKKWQKVFQTERLYNEVKDEVWSMNEYIRMQHDKKLQEYEEAKRLHSERLEKKLGYYALLIGVPGLSLTFLGAVGGGNLLAGLFYLFLGLVIGGIILLRLTQAKKS